MAAKQPHRASWEANGCTYTVNSKYIDIETGEILDRKKTKDIFKTKQYIKIKTTKEYEYNTNRTKCTVRYTVEVKRNPQQRLELS